VKPAMSILSSVIVLAIAAGWGQSPALAAPMPPRADAIYTGGDIVTVNDRQPQAEAIAIAGGRIVAVGSRDEVMKFKGAETRVVDLGGKTLIPGFVDPHGHVFQTGHPGDLCKSVAASGRSGERHGRTAGHAEGMVW